MLTDDVTANSAMSTSDQEKKDQELNRHQSDTLDALSKLMDKFPEYQRHYRAFQQVATGSLSDPSHLIENLKRLQSTLLPSLRHNLVCLARLFDPSALRQEPSHRLQLISENLSKLEESMDQIKLSFCLEPTRPFNEDDDDYLRLTLFKYIRLLTRIVEIKGHTCCILLDTSHIFIACFNFSNKAVTEDNREAISATELEDSNQIYIDAAKSIQLIDELNEWFGLPEFRLVHGFWKQIATSIPIPIHLHQSLSWQAVNHQEVMLGEHPPTEKFLQLSLLASPLLKLFRLFFKKSLETATIRGTFMMDVEMDMSRVQEILASTVSIIIELDDFIVLFHALDDDETEGLVAPIQSISKGFESLLSLLKSYILAASTSQVDHPPSSHPSKVHFKAWFHTWNEQFALVTARFIQACMVPLNQPAIHAPVLNAPEPLGEQRPE